MKPHRPHQRGSRAGFTLIELLLVISIIGVLVALLLPAVQTAREAANAQANRSNLVTLNAAIVEYQKLNGHFPTSLALLSQTGISQELLSGASSGYRYNLSSVTATDFVVQGTPAAPGQTGVEECTINFTRILRCDARAGATHNTGIMWTRVAARGAGGIASIVLQFTPGVTPEDIRHDLALGSTVPTAFQQLDVNNKGQVSIADILQSGLPNIGDLSNLYGAFLAGISQDMGLGAGNEHIGSLPGVRLFQLSSQRLCEGTQWSPCNVFPEPQ